MIDQSNKTPTTDPETSEAPSGESVSGPLAEEDVADTVTPATPTEETFPRSYVEKLRDESAKHRQRASDRDTLAQRLHGALVAATGRLADPSDLTFDEDHLTDPDALT